MMMMMIHKLNYSTSMANKKTQEMANLSSQICNQISSIFTKPTSPYPPPLDLLVTELAAISHNRNNSRIFLYGVGREGLMLKAFAMRLFHLGLSTHLVFDMTTPPITSSDLLIASAGPGGFSTVDAICSVAKSNGAKVILITAEPEIGSCVKHATDVCYVPAQTMASDNGGDAAAEMGERPLLPMGSVYEGALFVLFEMVVYKLGDVLGESSESVRARHTNLE
ncbi:Sugar isomerase (SIS) [Arabidopsis suecica]|uniref:Sugar isomerase (SIS) n=1 Tax=Arabidopsis suecica TaxID=45249 RepID=A0A8T1XTS6_ARASU|nr:Sugar isomerase (SIS) [Arabidopsis suecica]